MSEIATRLARSRWRAALGATAGAGAGAAYAHFIGCTSGTCPLTSNVWTAALFFGLAGGLAAWPAKPPASPAPGPARDDPAR